MENSAYYEKIMKMVEQNIKEFEELEKQYEPLMDTYELQSPEMQRLLDNWKEYREAMLEMKKAFEARKYSH